MPVLSRQAADTALDHYNDRQKLVSATSEVVGQIWTSGVDPRNILDSWANQLPEVTAVVSGAQLGAARPAGRYVDDMLDEEGVDPDAVAEPFAPTFAGQASDARGLLGLLTNPVFVVLSSIADGLDVVNALFRGKQNLDMLVSTQVADAGRLADQVGITSRLGAHGYIRLAVGKSCGRCLVLAGKFYQFNTGFQRHPKCDCIHVPANDPKARLARSPESTYARMTAAERTRAGFTLADQRAIAEGADLGQVVNAKRGMYTAGGRKLTTEGTTKRGLYGGYRIDPDTGQRVKRPRGEKAPPRLSVDEIFKISGDDRDRALELLADNGYVVNLPKRVSKAERLEIRRRAEAFIDGEIDVEDLAPWLSAPNAPSGAAGGELTQVTIRPELARAKTVRQVEFEFRSEYYAITGRRLNHVDFTGSVDTAKEHAEGILRGAERFPDANLQDVFTMVTPEDSRYAEAAYGYIAFSEKWTKNRKRYLDGVSGDMAAGFHPANSANPMFIAIHEFGHTMDIGTLGDRIAPQVEALIADMAAKTGVRADRLIALTVSEYAAKDTRELVAEAFADALVNGAKASPTSRKIMDLLEAEYRRPGSSRIGGAVVAPPSAAAPRVAKARPGSTIGDVELGPSQLDVALGEAPVIKRPAGDFKDRPYTGPHGAILARGKPLPKGFDSDLEAVRRGEFELRPGLSPDESQALDRYALSRVADPLNTGLRQGKTSGFGTAKIADQAVDLDEELRLLDSAIDAGRLAEDTTLYRGAIMRPADVGKLQVGAITSESGFLSTTTELENAFAIINWRQASAPARQSKVVFEILAPKGTRAGAGHIGELEVLLGRGRRMRVVEVRRPTKAGGSRHVVLEMLPDAPATAVAEVAEDLSKLAVPKLRALAKERGITVPPGSKKPDIVRLLAPPTRGKMSLAEISLDKAREHVADLEELVVYQVTNGASVKATTARARTHLRLVRIQPIDAAGNDLVNTSAARAVRYEWRQPGRTIRLDQTAPKDLTPIQLQEFDEAARLSRMALAVEDAQAAGADVVAAVRAARTADVAASPGGSAAEFEARVKSARKGRAATAQTEYRFSGNSNENADIFADRAERVAVMDAFAGYRGVGFSRINKKLRAGDLSDSRIGLMDRAFGRSPLGADVVVYRGTRGRSIFGPREDWPSDLTGVQWTDTAYASTSAELAIAEPFAKGDGVVMRVVVPKGTPAVGIRPAARIENPEAEILLGRGTTFKVVADHGTVDGIRRLDVEVLPAGAPTAAADDAARKALRTEARARQAEVDTARTRADALAELDELVGKSASLDVLTRNLDIFTQTKALAPADITALRRVLATRDRVKIAATVDRISKKYKLTGVHSAGDVTKMRDGFETVGGPIPAGADVQVIRRGTEIVRNGEVITVSRPVVRVVDLAEKNEATLQAYRGSAKALIEATELVHNGASLRALAHRARTLREQGGISDPAIEALFKAMESGDAAKIRRAVTAAAKKLNLAPIGAPGDLTSFDVKRFQSIGQPIERGATVRVIRPGYTGIMRGEPLLIEKAVVQEVDAAFLAQLRKTAIDDATAVISGAKPPTAAQLKKAGITKVGTVSKTKTVPFDPKAYDVKGSVPAAGAKVRVVEPGYSMEYRGETVVLRKPVVEVVATTPPARAKVVAINRDITVPEPKRLVAGSDILDPQLPAEIVREADSFAFSRDPGLAAIATRQGFDGLPSVVTREQLEALYEAGAPRMLRGFQAKPEKTALEMVEDMRSGRYFAGCGVYGNGYYFAPPNNRAGGAFTRAENFARNRGDALVRATLHPGARMVDYEEIRGIYEAYWRAQGIDPAVGISAYGRGPEDIVLSDLGRFAAAQGYDVIWDGFTRQWVVLNRTALIVEDVP